VEPVTAGAPSPRRGTASVVLRFELVVFVVVVLAAYVVADMAGPRPCDLGLVSRMGGP